MTDSDPTNRSEDPPEHPTQEMTVEASRSPLRMVPGDTIGAFKIISRIGEGGFGVVFLAEQTKPVKRRVALKVIKPGMDTKSVIARFEAERQALALMDYPGIAKVFEAGETPDGRPYFVMEYVKGEAINSYCDRHSLDTKSRLTLFAKVCDCVQHAHQKGIIHRDLKPGNILVTIDERDEPQPKVIDFGIAKATSQELTEKTIFTEQGQLIGTPEYMSPEQADLSAVDIDTRSDVYSLGVVLYELLSGQLPFDPGALRSKGYAEIQRIIREEDPPKPSTRLTTLDGVEGVRIAEQRKTKPSELKTTLRKELDWIPMKALRKDRSERYGSAEAMGDDVRRYLAGEPLEAGPESPTYRLKKLVRRNKGPFIAAALVALTLIAGIIGTTIFAVRAAAQTKIAQANELEADHQRSIAESQRRRAEQQTREAEEKAKELKTVTGFQIDQMAGIDVSEMGFAMRRAILDELEIPPSQFAGKNFTGIAVALINEHVLQQMLESIDDTFGNKPNIRAELLQGMALILLDHGLYEEAMPPQVIALELRREHLGNEHSDTLDSIRHTGRQFQSQGEFTQAERYYTEALESSRRIFGDDHEVTITSINDMGTLLKVQGKFTEAMEYFTEARDGSVRVLGSDHSKTITILNNLAGVLNMQTKFEEAMVYQREALEANRRIHGNEHPDTLLAIDNMGFLLRRMSKYDEAKEYFTEALEGYRRVRGNDHRDTLASISNLSTVLRLQARYEEAFVYCNEALEGRRRVLGDDHPETILSINDMGVLFIYQGKFEDALPYTAESLERAQTLLGKEHPFSLVSSSNMGSLLQRLKKYDEAKEYFVETLEILRSVRGNEDKDTLVLINNLGGLLTLQEKHEEARPYFAEALETRRRVLGNEHSDTLISVQNMGGLLRKLGEVEEAEALLREAYIGRQQLFDDEHPRTIESRNSLGLLLFDQQRYAEAAEFMVPVLKLRRDSLGDRHPSTMKLIEKLIALHQGWHEAEPEAGHDAKAAEYSALLGEIQLAVEEEKEAPSQP